MDSIFSVLTGEIVISSIKAVEKDISENIATIPRPLIEVTKELHFSRMEQTTM